MTYRIALLVILVFPLCHSALSQTMGKKDLFEFDSASSPRWATFENPTAEKGRAARENHGAKGHPSDDLAPGETKQLLKINGPGIINRIWITVNDRSPDMLRSLRLEMFWDGAATPAVSVPLGDFFGMGLGRTAAFHNALFADPEGRSFICYIPMPFKRGALIRITNESSRRLTHIFYDIDLQQLSSWKAANLYFHACWRRDTATRLAEDFQLLPRVTGRGRFLGVNVGVLENPLYEGHWWGEGEVKMYLDGDKDYPTLSGTGTEDYIGTAWSEGEFFSEYAGCLSANKDGKGWAFYRWHIPDPIFFKKDCRVTLPEMGSNEKKRVMQLQAKGVPLIPVTLDDQQGPPKPLYTPGKVTNLSDPSLGDGYIMFYRSDDVSATAYFYLDSPENGLPPLQPVTLRTYKTTK
jgi:hypothetical protein